ncbi:hypothetical protein MRX96_020692 [Rhipicephalus microplus]
MAIMAGLTDVLAGRRDGAGAPPTLSEPLAFSHNNMANGNERDAYNERLIDGSNGNVRYGIYATEITSPAPSLTRLGGTLQQ